MENKNNLSIQRHNLILYATLATMLIAYLATVFAHFTSSSHLSLGHIIICALISLVIFVGAYFYANKYPEQRITRFLVLAAIALMLIIYNGFVSTSSEGYVNFYLLIVAGIIYSEVFVTALCTVTIIVTHIILVAFVPELGPAANWGTLLLGRYTNFILIGIMAALVTNFTNKVANLAAEGQKTAEAQAAQLKNVSNTIAQKSEMLAASSEELLASATEGGEGAEQVSDSIEALSRVAQDSVHNAKQTAEIIRQMSAALNSAGHNVEEVTQQSTRFGDIVRQGLTTIEQQTELVSSNNEVQLAVQREVHSLQDKTEQIQNIVTLITGIAEQTNLLALNAAIEAARAGEAGRGFAVVAEEVRKLAENSGDAAQNITLLINEITDGMSSTFQEIDKSTEIQGQQVKAVEETQNMFLGIEQGAIQIDNAIQELSAAVQEILASTDEVVGQVDTISSSTEESADSLNEITRRTEIQLATSRALSELAAQFTEAAVELNSLSAETNS